MFEPLLREVERPAVAGSSLSLEIDRCIRRDDGSIIGMVATKKTKTKASLVGANTSELTVAPPTSIWNRPVKLNLGGFFTALGKLVVDVGTSQWAEVGKDAIDAVAAFGLVRGPQELAGLLISRSLMRTVEELIGPYRAEFPAVLFPGPIDFSEELDRRLAGLTVTLDERFLERPRELAIVGQFRELVEEWLGHVKLEGHSPSTIAARLPGRFVYALHRECIEHRGEYTRLFAELNSEFSAAWQRERSWEEYQHWFESELDGSVFGEDFGLAQIFQWPRAYYVRHLDGLGPGRRDNQPKEEEQRVVVTLREELDRWLSTRSHDDAIRVISGEPGAGKSSFARMYAAHRMALGDRVLVIPLHTVNVAHDLIETITSLCRSAPPYPDAPFADDASVLLILDGLDELSKQGREGERLASSFARHVRNAVNTRNLGSTARLQVLLSGRPIAVQDVTESDFRATGQVLHLVAYAVEKDSERNVKWEDPTGLLAVDQRHEWWRIYGELTQADYQKLPEALANKSLFDTTTQPLLGYLLALAYREALSHGQTIDRDVSRNEIYSRLIRAVFERDYNKPARGHIASQPLTREQFEALLEELALAAWHEDARVVRVSAVERLCARAGLKALLEHYMEASQAGIAQLFTAFYFRRSGARTNGGESFEFTHKSFAEYLVARRFVSELAKISEDLAERDASHGRRARGKDEPALLLDWLEVFGPSGITNDLLDYLEIEVRLQSATEDIRRWQDTLRRLINCVLMEGMPCERVGGLRFIDMRRWASNAEMSLLVMLQCCSEVTKRLTEIDWSSDFACASWIRQLQAMDHDVRLMLGWVAMDGQWMMGLDFLEAYLVCASLQDASLEGARFHDADLHGANLQGAMLEGAIFECANLRGADLVDANLENVDLRRADLEGADLEGAHLQDADLRGAKISPKQLASTQGTPRYLP